MWNAGLVEAQAGIKIARISINNLWYADDTTLMAKSEEELKKLLEENIGKTLSDVHHSRILYDPPPRILEIKAK